MYRDEREVLRVRVAEALADEHAVRAQLREQRAAVAALNQQLERSELPLYPLKALLPQPQDAAVGPDTSLAALVTLADVVETRVRQFQADVERFGSVIKILSGRLTGSDDALPLAGAPRDVPWQLIVCEVLSATYHYGRVLFFVTGFLLASAHKHDTEQGWVPLALVLLHIALVAWRSTRRVSMLRHGDVASVTIMSRETTSSSFRNWPMRRSRGWDVKTSGYTGRGVPRS